MTHDELKKIRAKMGLTQVEMSDELGVAIGTYNKWEYGNNRIVAATENLINRVYSDFKKSKKK